MTTRVCVRGKWNFPCLKCKGSKFKLIDGKYYLYCADLEEEIKKQEAYQVNSAFKDLEEGRYKTFTDTDALFKDLDEPEKKVAG